ncbi:hypothetical protein [Priestia koreensis]|uniref:Uncharacterized protein n=1 Tax=Priestia koreensis TaxID=284581 RepID=A0A0M0L6B3_9BACI|nr:hypothetical protein [Priestia koreensis]KOO46407.1 hypothetical protein AMD01_11280 [Priestia koreensis]
MYSCKLCDLHISFDDLIDEEFCCGRCTIDDWAKWEVSNDEINRAAKKLARYADITYEEALAELEKDRDELSI